MHSPFIQALNVYNLCTYYVLPFTGLSKLSFGVNNFINCFITPAGDAVIVQVVNKLACSPEVERNRLYRFSYTEQGFDMMVFEILPSWKKDVEKFKQGKYSQFSEEAKNVIILFSSLPVRLVDRYGQPNSDARIHALRRSPDLREKWQEELGIKNYVLSEEDELLSLPSPMNFKEYPNGAL